MDFLVKKFILSRNKEKAFCLNGLIRKCSFSSVQL